MSADAPTGTLYAKPDKGRKPAAPRLTPDRRALLVARIAERALARWLVMGVEGAKATASDAMRRKFGEIAEDAVAMAERCFAGEEIEAA